MPKPYTIAAIALFSLIALLQLLRVLSGWEVTINGLHIPLWVSGVAFIVTAGLATMLWRENRS